MNITEARDFFDDLGIDSLPLSPGDKKPAVAGWPRGTPYRLWRDAPEGANIGVRGGGPADLAIVDCDEPATFETVAGWLAGLGLLPDDYPVIQTASGAGRHVYLTATGLPGDWRKLSKDIGAGEFRYGAGSYVVAPPSIVAGSEYALIAGDFRQLPRVTLADILPILANQDLTTISRPVISRRAANMLNGQLIENYPSRSEAEQSLIVSLINTGYTFPEVQAMFDRYPCAGKYAELKAKSSKNAERWLRTSYSKAAAWAANESQARQLAANAITWAESTPWPGRTGAVNHLVYLAHANTAYKAGTLTYSLACRDLADQAGISHMTATRATWRLIRLGLLARERGHVADCANVYHLDDAVRNVTLPHSTYVRKCNTTLCSSADAFRWIGLGKAACEVWASLQQQPSTTAELAERTGRHIETIRKALRRMAHLADNFTGELFAMVERGEDGQYYALPDVDLDRVARCLGVSGRGERQRNEHERERRAHARTLAAGREKHVLTV